MGLSMLILCTTCPMTIHFFSRNYFCHNRTSILALKFSFLNNEEEMIDEKLIWKRRNIFFLDDFQNMMVQEDFLLLFLEFSLG